MIHRLQFIDRELLTRPRVHGVTALQIVFYVGYSHRVYSGPHCVRKIWVASTVARTVFVKFGWLVLPAPFQRLLILPGLKLFVGMGKY